MENLKGKIREIYVFFSHNIRTFNSEIVTTIECFKLGFLKEDDTQIDLIYEAAYLLDLYDTVFNICLESVLEDGLKTTWEECNISAVTSDLQKNIKGFLSESNIDLVFESPLGSFITDPFIFKNIYKVILYEIIRISKENVIIVSKEKRLEIAHGELISDRPPILEIFISILKKLSIDCTILDNSITMEFLK